MTKCRDSWILAWRRHLGSAPLNAIMGTPPYMAPEQARGQWERIDGRTDIYGLGAVLYALLTHQPPHPGRTVEESLKHAQAGIVTPPRALNRSVPRDLERIAMKALEADPSRRYAVASELRQALRTRRLRQRYWPVGFACAFLLVVGAAYSTALWATKKTDTERPMPGQLQQLIKVDRGGREVPLNDAVPLVSGDKLWIECELPSGLQASAFWLDSEGKISELSPLSIKKEARHDHLSYPPPESANNAVTLEGPAGTEMVLVCARPGTKVDRSEIEALILPTAARTILRDRSTLLIGRGRVELRIKGTIAADLDADSKGTRGLGAPEASEARTAQESFRHVAEALEDRIAFVAAAVFPHKESRAD